VADTFREQGQQSNVQQLAVADAADDQAKTFRLRARQTLQQAGFIDEARAIGLRVQGHQHRVQAEKASAQAEVDTLLASSLGARSASLHQTVLVIRATGPDADLKAVASQLDQMSRADAREARRLDSEARRLTSSGNRLADSYYRQADRLDPGGL
jgi:hypothetical protein